MALDVSWGGRIQSFCYEVETLRLVCGRVLSFCTDFGTESGLATVPNIDLQQLQAEMVSH